MNILIYGIYQIFKESSLDFTSRYSRSYSFRDYICYLVESFVDEMDFSEFEVRYNGSGHPSYHPCIMCKILIQLILDRVRSSRVIARNVRENVV